MLRYLPPGTLASDRRTGDGACECKMTGQARVCFVIMGRESIVTLTTLGFLLAPSLYYFCDEDLMQSVMALRGWRPSMAD